ncbi:efflux RND transporter periplasmic adaptor subunit [Erythrobacter sp. W53]|uniref:efflux RND transporter periplasmic adaptor subunit n=1 Tax=Erythrobacter sp. W53 TaxID=3425947 RepID=UPI003D767A80
MSDETQPEEFEPGAGNNKTKFLIGGGIAAAVMLGAYVYANSGETVWSDTEAQADTADSETEGKAVAAAEEPEPEPELSARGVIKAKEESTVASRMTAKITALPFGQGQSFRRGALLARFDCSSIRAQLAAARASANAYQTTYETNVELDAFEAVGKNEVAVSRANLGKANAEAAAISAQLKDCAVYAPFSGSVVEEIASKGEIAASGQPLMRIQSGGDLEAELIVPSNWLTWLRPGADFTFAIDETGVDITGSVTRLGAAVDPVSKTIRISANIDRGDGLVLPGMSGTATFKEPEPEPEPEAEPETPDGAPEAQETSGTDGRQSS